MGHTLVREGQAAPGDGQGRVDRTGGQAGRSTAGRAGAGRGDAANESHWAAVGFIGSSRAPPAVPRIRQTSRVRTWPGVRCLPSSLRFLPLRHPNVLSYAVLPCPALRAASPSTPSCQRCCPSSGLQPHDYAASRTHERYFFISPIPPPPFLASRQGPWPGQGEHTRACFPPIWHH